MVNRYISTKIDVYRHISTRIAQNSTFFDIYRRTSTKIDSCRPGRDVTGINREPTGASEKNMGNMGIFFPKRWEEYGSFQRFLGKNMGNMGGTIQIFATTPYRFVDSAGSDSLWSPCGVIFAFILMLITRRAPVIRQLLYAKRRVELSFVMNKSLKSDQ